MTLPQVEFLVRCTCGAALPARWEEPAHAFTWEEVKKQKCLVIEPCMTCKSKPVKQDFHGFYDY
jgi:hypothetical protein